jgi:hypothetical protein
LFDWYVGCGKSEVTAGIAKELERQGKHGAAATPYHIHRSLMNERLEKCGAQLRAGTCASKFGLPMFDVPTVAGCVNALSADAAHDIKTDDFLLLDEAMLNPGSRLAAIKGTIEKVRKVPDDGNVGRWNGLQVLMSTDVCQKIANEHHSLLQVSTVSVVRVVRVVSVVSEVRVVSVRLS